MPATKPFSVRRTSAGLGLVANNEYKKGDFIIEYTGEIITDAEADERANRYLFEINGRWTIDGSGRTNLARYINHSCRPNAEAEVDERAKKVRIYAKKRIEAGDELTYDYGKVHFDEYIRPNGCKCEKCMEKQ
ncbi:MAG: SET domain-containing protein [Candidatus Paceibacterota bacterium]